MLRCVSCRQVFKDVKHLKSHECRVAAPAQKNLVRVCKQCQLKFRTEEELGRHECRPWVPDDLDYQLYLADLRDFLPARERKDRYEAHGDSYTRTCNCGTPMRPGQAACDFCQPDDNNFRPAINLPPPRDWLRLTKGLRVYQLSSQELSEYNATGRMPVLS